MKWLLLLMLAGCAANPSNPSQIEGNSSSSPLCLWWCVSTKTITYQEGAKIDSASGQVSIQKNLSNATTETISTTETQTKE